MNSTQQWRTIILVVGISVLLISVAESAPYNGYYSQNIDETPENVLIDFLERFSRSLIQAREDLANSKRTVDFGLGRGLSGAMEAKHRLGMAAANFAGGPGRRRRSETSE